MLFDWLKINKCCGLKLARPDRYLTHCVFRGVVYMLVNLCHSLQHTEPSGVSLGCLCNMQPRQPRALLADVGCAVGWDVTASRASWKSSSCLPTSLTSVNSCSGCLWGLSVCFLPWKGVCASLPLVLDCVLPVYWGVLLQKGWTQLHWKLSQRTTGVCYFGIVSKLCCLKRAE